MSARPNKPTCPSPLAKSASLVGRVQGCNWVRTWCAPCTPSVSSANINVGKCGHGHHHSQSQRGPSCYFFFTWGAVQWQSNIVWCIAVSVYEPNEERKLLLGRRAIKWNIKSSRKLTSHHRRERETRGKTVSLPLFLSLEEKEEEEARWRSLSRVMALLTGTLVRAASKPQTVAWRYSMSVASDGTGHCRTLLLHTNPSFTKRYRDSPANQGAMIDIAKALAVAGKTNK